jgi:uncharacterized protein (TIGR02246 family)
MHSKRYSFWIVIALLVGATSNAGPAPGADEAAIRAQTTAWMKAYNAADAKSVAALYADDAMLAPPEAPAAAGRTAILAFFTKDVAGAKSAGLTLSVTGTTDVGVSGDLGWESGTYAATVKGAVVGTGKFLSVSRKKDGKWLYIRDTWNSDAAPKK